MLKKEVYKWQYVIPMYPHKPKQFKYITNEVMITINCLLYTISVT